MSVKTKADMLAKLERLTRESLKRGYVQKIEGDGEACYQVGNTFEGASLIISHDLGAYDLRFNGESAAYIERNGMFPHFADYYRGLNEALELTLAHCENQERIRAALPATAKDDRTLIQEALLNSFYVHSDQERYLVGSPEPEDQSIFMTIRHDLMHFDVSLGGLTVVATAAPADHLEAYYARLLKYLRITLRITDACMLQENYLENGE